MRSLAAWVATLLAAAQPDWARAYRWLLYADDDVAFLWPGVLRMLRGQRAAPAFEGALDTYLATVADHGFNASTFTARVASSAGADLYACVGAAISMLLPAAGGVVGTLLTALPLIATAVGAVGSAISKPQLVGSGFASIATGACSAA